MLRQLKGINGFYIHINCFSVGHSFSDWFSKNETYFNSQIVFQTGFQKMKLTLTPKNITKLLLLL